MENEIAHMLKITKIREMKNPVIVMNPLDFEEFKTKLELNNTNFIVSENPKFQGISIITRYHIEKGNIFIVDWLPNTGKLPTND
jgi:hypothetical protein